MENAAANGEQIKVVLENGEQRQLAYGTTVGEFLKSLESDETKGVVAVKANDSILDTQTPLLEDSKIKFIRLKDDTKEARLLYRHSFSHILAQAVRRLYPGIKLAIGPATKDGFYYDFEVEKPFTPDDLDKISAEMKKIVKEKHRFERIEVSFEEGKKMLEEGDESYKLELLEGIEERGENITFYRDGDFLDLCRGPHVPDTSKVKHFQLLDIAGAYWRGDEKRQMLQRIYGTAFLNKEDLEKYLWELEEAKKRDHRKLGKELDLFSIQHDTIGAGLILWHPKGGLVRHLMEAHCKERHLEAGYDFVVSPHVGLSTLWETSGHLDFYKDGMFPPLEMDGHTYYLKPMNCPFHVNIFKNKRRSYRELPARYAEWGTVYRFERSGAVHGLTRVRGFTQDDAHLFCREDQMAEEIDRVVDFSLGILRDFGLNNFHLYLSTRPEKRVGDESKWDSSEAALEAALKRSGLPYTLNEGDGAFYGPKIDICVYDALGREWQLSTIQFDFNLPERFDLTYVGDDGQTHRPYMIHRALMGSMERFFGILIEHYAGAFPVWLAPVQIEVLPIAERHTEYAQKVAAKLKTAKLRAEVDSSSNTLGYRIRNAETQKIPFMLVVGDNEEEAGTVAIRRRGEKDQPVVSIEECIEIIGKQAMSPSGKHLELNNEQLNQAAND